MRGPHRTPTVLPVLLAIVAAAPTAEAQRRPNLVFILADNQGAWMLGSYGNPDIRTPNIDRLASDGIRFTRALSSNPVCSPTRATFLTGLLPSQHGVHSFLDPRYMMGAEAYNTLAEFTSLGEVLRDAGYVYGLSGKWHLGANLTPSEGFSFWVTKPDGHTNEFYDQDVIEEGKVRRETGYTTELWTRRGIQFIESLSPLASTPSSRSTRTRSTTSGRGPLEGAASGERLISQCSVRHASVGVAERSAAGVFRQIP